MSAQAISSMVVVHSPDLLSPFRRLCERLTSNVGPVNDLEKLSEHLLVDIGVDPRTVRDEARMASDRLYLLERGFSRL